MYIQFGRDPQISMLEKFKKLIYDIRSFVFSSNLNVFSNIFKAFEQNNHNLTVYAFYNSLRISPIEHMTVQLNRLKYLPNFDKLSLRLSNIHSTTQT
jgi:hypothetical protein